MIINFSGDTHSQEEIKELIKEIMRLERLADKKKESNRFTAQSIIEFVENTRPKITFEVDERTLRAIHRLTDDNGRFLWEADLREWCKNGTIMGHKVVLADEDTCQIRYEFADGSSHVVKYDKGE